MVLDEDGYVTYSIVDPIYGDELLRGPEVCDDGKPFDFICCEFGNTGI